MRLIPVLAALAAAVTAVSSAAVPGVAKDAPYSVPLATIQAAVECPRGIKGRKGGVVLLVHGTGSTGSESWGAGPYVKILPDLEPGFDVCWVTLPNRSLDDIQVASEYVAGNIKRLASKSSTGKISLIGHSQGAGNIQWALTFWPSLRKYVQDNISLSGAYQGSTVLNFCRLGTICPTAFLQQTFQSRFSNALNVIGGAALVPTTNIITRTDEIVQPTFGPVVTGYLRQGGPGALSQFALQDPNVCGPLQVAEHFSMIINPAAFGLAYTALTTKGPARKFNVADCLTYRQQGLLGTVGNFVFNLPANLAGIGADILGNLLGGPRVGVEPKLKRYVCDSGSAPRDQCE